MGYGTQDNGINSLMIPRNLKWLTRNVTNYESSNALNYPFATLYNPNIWHSTKLPWNSKEQSYHEIQRMGTCQNIPQKQSLQSFMTKQVTCVTWEQVKEMTNVFETVHITGNLLSLFPFSSYPLICDIMQWYSCTKHSATRRSAEDCGPFHCLSNNITYLLILFINGVKSRASMHFMKLIKNAYMYGAPRKWSDAQHGNDHTLKCTTK